MPDNVPHLTRAAELLRLYGRSSNDYFKLWPDKQHFFTPSGNGFVAYAISQRTRPPTVLVLGDPVAPEAEMAETLALFLAHCRQRGWLPIFHQVLPDFLDLYRAQKFRVFKASEEAVVDLESFTLIGKAGKYYRKVLNGMRDDGVRTRFFDAPVPDEVVEQARVVSEAWLANGRRERRFMMGYFTPDYARNTPLLAAFDSNRSDAETADGVMLGFVNLIPSYAPETATLDMMRFHPDGPRAIMDFLFVKLFELHREQGVRYISLGDAPIIELPPDESASLEEKAFYRLTRYLDNYFNAAGLRNYKEKFRPTWEPRYLIYRRTVDWPRVLRAYAELTEFEENRQPLWGRAQRREFRRVTAAVIGDIRRARRERRRPPDPLPDASINNAPTNKTPYT